MRLRYRYALWGVLLGLGAPAGSLLWRGLTRYHADLSVTLILEWQSATYYYVYMTVGTVIAFALFGFVLGRRNEALNELSITDGLTGIYNVRYLHKRLEQELARSARYGFPVTCLMLDIDDFKSVNDRFGHPFGNEVLQQTAEVIGKAVRQTDTVGRYGGEEFLVIMPETNTDVASKLADRILLAVEKRIYTHEVETVHVTVSIGLAMYPDPDRGVKSKSALLSGADQALYKAKMAGKNRVVVWDP